MSKAIIFCMGLIVLLTSCTKEVEIDLDNVEPKIVIEGDITNEAGSCIVKISKTVDFSESNNYPPVTGALVIVSDNTGISDTLDETAPGIYRSLVMNAVPGRTYYMKVAAEGRSYAATSTMPEIVNLDSLDFVLFTNNGNSGGKEYLTQPVFTDPPMMGNAYQFIQTVNGKPDNTIFVTNDNTFNGLVNTRTLMNPDNEIKSGDSVVVEFRCIDRSTYDYYFTLSQISGGPFGATPTNPPNNITGDYALGLFSAHTVQVKSTIVP